MTETTFTSRGVRCAAWHLPAAGDAFASPRGRPCVVMAHGFGGTWDTGLPAYAEAFARVGIDAFVFDYRGFGASGSTPPARVLPASAPGLPRGHRRRPGPARRLTCPILVQAGDRDMVAPLHAPQPLTA